MDDAPRAPVRDRALAPATCLPVPGMGDQTDARTCLSGGGEGAEVIHGRISVSGARSRLEAAAAPHDRRESSAAVSR